MKAYKYVLVIDVDPPVVQTEPNTLEEGLKSKLSHMESNIDNANENLLQNSLA